MTPEEIKRKLMWERLHQLSQLQQTAISALYRPAQTDLQTDNHIRLACDRLHLAIRQYRTEPTEQNIRNVLSVSDEIKKMELSPIVLKTRANGVGATVQVANNKFFPKKETNEPTNG